MSDVPLPQGCERRPFEVDAAGAGQRFADLMSHGDTEATWRVHQWEKKARLLDLNAQIGAGDEWTPERLESVEAFWAAQENLQRHVWGLGTMRHIFGRRFTPLPWYQSWAKHQSEQAASMRDEQ